jgi:hypothetical protein
MLVRRQHGVGSRRQHGVSTACMRGMLATATVTSCACPPACLPACLPTHLHFDVVLAEAGHVCHDLDLAAGVLDVDRQAPAAV